MKKSRLFSVILALLLALQAVTLPALAEEEETTVSSSETGVSESTGPTLPPAPVVLPDIPLSVDASVENGAHSLDAGAPVAGPEEYQAAAKGAILYDLNSDTMIYALNPDERLYPASLTKIMTCMLALEMTEDLQEIVTVPEDVIARVDPSGSSMDLVPGEEVPMIDLLYGIMVQSANDAAMVVADHLAGSEEAFIERMNQEAEEIGCTNTHFKNVHGLHDEEHYTSARDMAKIMHHAIQNETFQMLYSTPLHEVAPTNKSEMRTMRSTNYLISEATTHDYYDSRVIGGKTGFTTPAGRCLASVSEDSSTGMKLLCVVLGTKIEIGPDGYSVLSYGNFEETKGLMNFGYDNYMSAQVLSSAQTLGSFEVTDGDAMAHGRVQGDVATVLPQGSTVDSIQYDFVLDDGVMKAPLKEGQPIGVVRVWYLTRCVAQQELYAAGSVRKAVPMAEIPNVDPAQPSDPGSSLWHWVLIAILVLLAAIFLMLLGGHIRAAMIRRKRKKLRAARRKSAQNQNHRPRQNPRQDPRRNPDERRRR